MFKRIMAMLAVAALSITLLIGATGCGDEEPEAVVTEEALDATISESEEDLNRRIEELEKKELTVEVIDDGKTLYKWSQDGKGSWRLEESADSYTIYNAEQNKGWSVSGNTATEYSDPAFLQLTEAMGPITMLSAYAGFGAMPRTGGSDDVWEWNVPGYGSLTVELKGPDGLISKIIGEDPDSGRTELEFRYSNVGNVPDSLFELPSGVTVQSTSGTVPGTSTGMMPDTSGLYDDANGGMDTSGYEDLTP